MDNELVVLNSIHSLETERIKPTISEIEKHSGLDRLSTTKALMELQRAYTVESGQSNISNGRWARIYLTTDAGKYLAKKRINIDESGKESV